MTICVSKVRIIITKENLIIITISAKNELLCLQTDYVLSVIQHYQLGSVDSVQFCVWVAAVELLAT